MIFSTIRTTIFRKTVSLAILAALLFSNAAAVSALANATNELSAQSGFTTDLTQLGREGRLRESIAFPAEVDRLVQLLARDGSRQPMIVDETGNVQDEIVEQAAIRLANDPAGISIVKIETRKIYSNLRSDKDIQSAVDAIVSTAIASKGKTVLFVDDITAVSSNELKDSSVITAVKDGKLRLIAGSTKSAFVEKFAKNADLLPLFEVIEVSASASVPSKDDDSNVAANGYRGDNVSPDLREMMANDATGSKRLDVILQAKDADNSSLRMLLKEGSARIVSRIGRSDTIVVNASLSAIRQIAASGLINYVSPDRPTQSTGHIEDTTGVTLMRSQAALNGRAAYTLDGTGIGVAVLDSGIYADHNGFKNGSASRIVANVNFTSANMNATGDGYGHGTHVAGLAVGSSTLSSSAYKGIASRSNLVSVKVLDDQGRGQTSWLLNGLNWVLQNKTAYNIRVVNLSLGADAIDTYTNDPICLKVKQLVLAGIVVVAAAGNDGKTSNGQQLYGRIHSPGNSPYTITVGASNSLGTTSMADDSIATYSSRGPTRSYYTNASGTKVYDNVVKPDLVAPGNKIVSHQSPNNVLAASNTSLLLSNDSTTAAQDKMMYMSGTSMSAPVVAGAAALLLQVNPNLTPGMIKAILQFTARPINGANMYQQGAGELNMDGAVRLARSLRTDVDFQTLTRGTTMVPSGWTMPATSTTIGGNTFNWSKIVFTNHGFLKKMGERKKAKP